MSGPVLVGLSGWSYDEWRHGFYAGVRRKDWLAHYARHFPAVEINASFYGRLRPETWSRWRDQTPPDFRFAAKANRFLTHRRRLAVTPDETARQRDEVAPLGEKLAALLWQCPASLAADHDLLRRFLDTLARAAPDLPHVLELRHASWFTPETAALLADRGVAAAVSDAADWPRWEAATAPLAYLRLHGSAQTYVSSYSPDELARWAGAIRSWLAQGRAVQAYFDNTAQGHAVANGLELKRMLEKG
ncbi:MAG: DUF72 domain-containing protein [Thermodesulfobacteriota bacterium]